MSLSKIISNKEKEKEGSSSQRTILDIVLRWPSTQNKEKQLDEIIDPEQDYHKFRTDGLTVLNPKTLHKAEIFENKTKFYKHTREIELECLDGDAKTLNLIGLDSNKELRDKVLNSYI